MLYSSAILLLMERFSFVILSFVEGEDHSTL